MLSGEERMNCTAAKIFRDFIAARGLNMSRQRTLVLGAFLLSGQQITVDDLFTELRSRQPALGRSTVYRTMKLIAECGLARVILVDGTCRYEKHQQAEHKSPILNRPDGAEAAPSGQDG